MEPTALVKVGVTVSIALTVFALGLATAGRDLTAYLRRPGLVIRSMVAMNVIMPLAAAVIALGVPLHPSVQVAVVALALAPVPPILPRKQMAVSDDRSYIVGLLSVGSALAIVVSPIVLSVLARVFRRDIGVPPGVIAGVVATTVLLPLAAGLLVHRLSPAIARRLHPWVSKVGGGLLLVAVLAVLVMSGRALWTLVGNGTLFGMAVLVAVGLLVGHLVGGPDRADRPVLALATANRHPGVAIAIAASASQVRNVAPAILLYLIVAMIGSAPYVTWQKRRRLEVAARRDAVERGVGGASTTGRRVA